MENKARNINDAFDNGVRLLQHGVLTREVAPRGMVTREFVEPVTTIYRAPAERVLFSPARDANPFLHFFEALWLLQGRQDVAFPKHFSSRMSDFSDDGERFNGAYGWRWRNEYGFDQITAVIDLLKHDRDSRRAVLAMWNPADLKWGVKHSKDVPCNTQVFFKVREGRLDMTVTCRSNDMLWGAYGSNVVQFSMLMEYVAGKLGVGLGQYVHLSDSFHVYLPPHPGGQVWERVVADHQYDFDPYDPIDEHCVRPFPMISGDDGWDDDLKLFFKLADNRIANARNIAAQCMDSGFFRTIFFERVVRPLWNTWHSRSVTDLEACVAGDWKLAARDWLARRQAAKLLKEGK